MHLNQILERDTHVFFNNNGVVDMTTDGKQLDTVVVLTAEGGEPVTTTTKNGRRDGDGLTVGDLGSLGEDSSYTVVGQPQRPAPAGKGGRERGRPYRWRRRRGRYLLAFQGLNHS